VIPAAERFVGDLRALHGAGLDDDELWRRAEPLLRELLTDETLRARAEAWPVSHDATNQRYTNLLFYEDPDFGFVLNGLVKDRSGNTAVHDHGHSWVLYGLLEGGEVVTRYQRVDDGSVEGRAELEETAELPLAAGDVDVVPPWSAHKERAVTDRTVAVIVRSANVGDFLRSRYDLPAGTVELRPGPDQVPHPLT
jgi:predicted metal-dependent enzyme (double-stranded beta helix superfamily)